jgi:hypothetical protein
MSEKSLRRTKVPDLQKPTNGCYTYLQLAPEKRAIALQAGRFMFLMRS